MNERERTTAGGESAHSAGDGATPVYVAGIRPAQESGGTTAELLAAVLGTRRPSARGLRAAERLLRDCGGLAGLAQAVGGCEGGACGVSRSAARRVAAALELGRRALLEPQGAPLQVRTPHDIGPRLVAEMALLEQECLRVVVLNTQNHVLAIPTVAIGGIAHTPVHARDVFREAVRRNATGVILAHNHPSSDLTPSQEDVEVTRMLIQAGALLDIAVLDHLVIARGGYVSLRERRLGFSSGTAGGS